MISLWLFNVFMDIRNVCGNVNDISVWSVNEQVFLNVDDTKLLTENPVDLKWMLDIQWYSEEHETEN